MNNRARTLIVVVFSTFTALTAACSATIVPQHGATVADSRNDVGSFSERESRPAHR
jgi:hypothetical protein